MNPLRLIRELKGAPLAIIMALGFGGRRVSAAWLSSITGYTDKPITAALTYLSEIGLVDHTPSGWTLTPSGRAFQPQQLTLTLPDPAVVEATESNRNNSDPLINNDSLLNNKEDESLTNNNAQPNSENIRPPEVQAVIDAAYKALTSAGIIGKKRAALCMEDRITPYFVDCWIKHLNETCPGRWKPGLLIRYLEDTSLSPPKYKADIDDGLTIPGYYDYQSYGDYP